MLKLDAICRNMTLKTARAALADPQTPPKRREMLRTALAAARHKLRLDLALAEELAERVPSWVRAKAQPTILNMWRLLRDAGADDPQTRANTPDDSQNARQYNTLANALRKAQERPGTWARGQEGLRA